MPFEVSISDHSGFIPVTPGKKMHGTLAGSTMNFRYTPDAGVRSSKIVLIQVMREYADGVAVLPSKIDATFSFQDPDCTAGDFYHVDYVSGELDPYYNGDDAGDFGVQGRSRQSDTVPARDCTSSDTPNFGDAAFPAGIGKIRWEFRTAAFAVAGPDQGKFYQYIKWQFDKVKGQSSFLTNFVGDGGESPGPRFRAAVDLWCKNHGFVLPKILPPKPHVPGETYVVKAGDYLSKIAMQIYGDGNLWRTIYNANVDVIGPDPNKIFAGQILVVP